MSNLIRQIITASLLLVANLANSQSAKDIFSNSGIWEDYGIPVKANGNPEFKGRLVNIAWGDIEVSPNIWDWAAFDNDINDHIADGMPVIFMVYTGSNAPNWLYSNGVPKVNQTNSSGGSVGVCPYYMDEDYNFYFKRMITTVRQHVESMDASIRNKIIGVQACFGSTGDQIAYKGDVASQYAISTDQFDSLFKVYSLYYYNEYKNLSPQVTMLSNTDYENPDQLNWLRDSCPGGWTKCGTMAKGVQLNLESDKNEWLYDMLNKPANGAYTKSRSEIVGSQLYSGLWTSNQYKQMFGIMCYCIYWGIDWPNETSSIILDPKHDSAFNFFNKYASQKVPGLAQHALCALKDVLDASDTVRFPTKTYGMATQTNESRYKNIYSNYTAYGALLQDVSAATGNEYACLGANGINDVGWHLLPGNYERYLHQIDANSTSAGYWNVDAAHPDVMYGRFARGFDIANGKNALYFDVENAFLRNIPLRGAYPVTIEVTYFDNGTGSFQLYYNSMDTSNTASSKITCTDTKTWKKAVFVLNDARFANKAERNSDFYIKNTGSSNVIFSTVELSREAQSSAAFITTPVSSFDTVCQNADVAPKDFVLNAASLDGSKVKIGPLPGFLFSTKSNGSFTPSIFFTNYGSTLNYTIYVKMNTRDTGTFIGKVLVKGGGLATGKVSLNGTVFNANPTLTANVNTISCNNRKDGAIDLKLEGGKGPFSYTWKNDTKQFWSDSNQNISDLNVANYTVTVNSFAGCSVSKTYSITQPDILVTSVAQDSAIICRGGFTTVNVSAFGGTAPYTGTGTLTVAAGFKTYAVTDQRGCTSQLGYSVVAGTISAPNKPGGIDGPTTVTSGQTNIVYTIPNAINTNTYNWTVPSDATILSGQNTSSVTVKWGATTGNLTVEIQNVCGSSPVAVKVIKVSKGLNAFAAVLPGTENQAMLLMPNPVKDIATIKFSADRAYTYSINVNDISGKLLLSKKGTAVTGVNTEKLNVQQFANGAYFITIINDKGEKQAVKMIKQN
ncbi:MAG: T9SS type A sorting domain-containing protein [Parafilimonas sp.]